MKTGMRLALARLRGEWARSTAIGVAIAVAVTAFIVLAGTTRRSELQTTGTVSANFRSSYDILVRPPHSRTRVESRAREVRSNYLSGIYGGITLRQALQVRNVPGVAVAAPIAMLGQVLESVPVPVDVTRYVGATGRAVVRYRSVQVSQHGLSRVTGQAGYVYVTPNNMSLPPPADGQAFGPYEEGGRGKPVLVCASSGSTLVHGSPFSPAHQWQSICWSRSSGQDGMQWSSLGAHRYAAMLTWSFPVTIAAIDPAAEAALTGVDKTVDDGRYLKSTDRPRKEPGESPFLDLPVLVSSKQIVDEHALVTIDALSARYANRIASGLSEGEGRRIIGHAKGRRVATVRVSAAQAYGQFLGTMFNKGEFMDNYWQPGPVTYRMGNGSVLHPMPVRVPSSTWQSQYRGFALAPADASNTAFRTMHERQGLSSSPGVSLQQVGTFDPTKIRGFSALSEVPLETYRTPAVTSADAATRKLLGDKPLLPDLNPAGYQQAPPLLLTTLRSIPAFTNILRFQNVTNATDPISVIRVRVAGVTGTNDASRQRIELVANRIRQQTGLDVDITIGASPAPRVVGLPATRNGAPALQLSENWVKKGVAYAIVSAVDRKSLLLFILILAACALTVGSAASASVRARRRELGVLACLGWRPRTLYRAVFAELAVIALAAGVAGAAIAVPVGHAVGAGVSVGRALLAVPAAVALALVAGLVPAARAARAVPLEAVRPSAREPRHPVKLHGVLSMALAYLSRTKARAAAGAAALALGVAALTVLIAIEVSFRGTVVATLLGNAVAVQVRTPDIIAGILVAVLGLTSIADVIYLDVRENATHYASLQASGWRDATLLRLVLTQAIAIGLAGALIGGAVGLGLTATLAPPGGPALATAGGVVVAATMLAALTAVAPATRLRRLQTARLLAQE